MTVEVFPTIEEKRQCLDELPEIAVVGEFIDKRGGTWQEWREVYVAPRQPAYTLQRIQAVHNRLVAEGFQVCNGANQDEFYLSSGSVNFDQGDRRLLVCVYPDEAMAKERYAWDTTYRENRLEAFGKPEPAKYTFPRDLMKRKEWAYQIRRIASHTPFLNRLVH